MAQFEPTTRDTDVFVTTSSKCGQTWLQNLLVHLKTKGQQPDLGGKGLFAASPWLELPDGHGLRSGSSRQERLASVTALEDPRIFKMHVVWDEVPRATSSRAKVMSITRDPRDVPYSMYSHLQAMHHTNGEEPTEDFDAYFEEWLEFGFFFRFMKSFWPHAQEPDVLLLRYEDLQRDLRHEARRILQFLDWTCSAEDLDRVLPLVDFARLRSKEKSEIFRNQEDTWKKDAHFFREGGVGKNRARLSADQDRRIVERTRAELGDVCADFVLSLDRSAV